MSISLTANQKRFIQIKLETEKYYSAEEILEIALQLLDEYNYEYSDDPYRCRGKGKEDAFPEYTRESDDCTGSDRTP